MEKVNLSSVRNSTANEHEWNFLLSSYWLGRLEGFSTEQKPFND